MSNTGRPEQKISCTSAQHHDYNYHLNTSRNIYQSRKGIIEDVSNTCEKFAGFFILTHKQAWKDAGGFKEGFLGVDFDYYYRLRRAGYKRYVMKDLYLFHSYKRHWKVGDFEA